MEIRKITKDEMKTVVKLHQYAYGFWTDQDITDTEHDFMIPENMLGLFETDELQSALTIMKVKQSIRGILKGMGGISMVCTYPEARMKGYARSLMQSAFLEMKEEGLSVSMLEPFRETFYARLGYVPAYEKYRLKAPLDGLRVASQATIGDDWTFDRLPGQKAKDTYMTFIQDFAPNKFHGYAFNPEIRDEEWKRRNKNRLYVIVKRQGKVEALARYQIKGYMHFEEEGQLIVEEMYWRNLSAQAALFSFFGRHRDQVTTLKMLLPYGANFQHWFMDLKDWIELKVWNPWMVRVVDVQEALTGLPASTNGELTFTLTDPQCGWNNGTYILQGSSNRLSVTPTKKTAKIEMAIQGLSALTYGTNAIDAIEYAGWIKGLNRRNRNLLQDWFPQLYLYNPYNF